MFDGTVLGPSSIDWDKFKRWLIEGHTVRNACDIYRVARKHYVILWKPNEASDLANLSDSNRRLVMAAMANLSKFLGMYRIWRDTVANTGLKWSNGSSEDVIIKRFSKPESSEELVDWIKLFKKEIPGLSPFIDFIALTGMRFVETVESFNLIIELNGNRRLAEYYNAERELLEHYKFKEIFMRKSKKVFVSFASKSVMDSIKGCRMITKNAIENRVKRRKISSRFGDIREYWASYMTRHLTQPEIDFLQGRISASIFMRHYFNPAWIEDLKTRALKGESEILAKIA